MSSLICIVLLVCVSTQVSGFKETAADTYKVVEASFNDTGIPSAEGIPHYKSN